jgi:hypothetical protein
MPVMATSVIIAIAGGSRAATVVGVVVHGGSLGSSRLRGLDKPHDSIIYTLEG